MEHAHWWDTSYKKTNYRESRTKLRTKRFETTKREETFTERRTLTLNITLRGSIWVEISWTYFVYVVAVICFSLLIYTSKTSTRGVIQSTLDSLRHQKNKSIVLGKYEQYFPNKTCYFMKKVGALSSSPRFRHPWAMKKCEDSTGYYSIKQVFEGLLCS